MAAKTKLDRNNTSFDLKLFELLKNAKFESKYDFLKYYQNLVRHYVENVDTGARGMLIYHTMGMGKSIMMAALLVDILLTGGRQPILLMTKSLQSNMRKSIHKYVALRAKYEPTFFLAALNEADLDGWIDRNMTFVTMNASNMLKQVNSAAEGRQAEEFDVALEKRLGEIVKLASLNGKLLLVDEAHNLFRAIVNGSKNGIGLYDMVMSATNLITFFFTGTPIATGVFELVPCFNMIGSAKDAPLFPESYREFTRLFTEPDGRIKNREKFQNRIKGLVSYVSHKSNPGAAVGISIEGRPEFPDEVPLATEYVNMDPDQYVIYQLARDKEKDEGGRGRGGGPNPNRVAPEPPSMTKPKSGAASTYRVKSRQLSNWCPPPAYRNEKDPEKIPAEAVNSAKFRRIHENIRARPGRLGLVYSQFVGVGGLGSFARFLDANGWERVGTRNYTEDKPDDYTGGADPATYAAEFVSKIEREMMRVGGDDPADFAIWGGGGGGVGGGTAITFKYADESNMGELSAFGLEVDRTQLVYPNYFLIIYSNGAPVGYAKVLFSVVSDGGFSACSGKIEHLSVPPTMDVPAVRKIIKDAINCSRDAAGFKKYIWGSGEPLDVDPSGAMPAARPGKKLRYALISGAIDTEERDRITALYNSDDNKHGGKIDLILLSSAGAEGLDLKNIRHEHIMEPYWSWSRIEQIRARGIRNNSHTALPPAERNVESFIYVAIPPLSEIAPDGKYAPTTDVELYKDSLAEDHINRDALDMIQQTSIECMINAGEHCRVCSPTDKRLFTDDIGRDVAASDPCGAVTERKLVTKKLVHDGEEYHYVGDPNSIFLWKVYVFDKNINAYRALPESAPAFMDILEQIEAANRA